MFSRLTSPYGKIIRQLNRLWSWQHINISVTVATRTFRFYNLFFVFLTYFLISTGAYVLRPVPCVPVGSRVPVKAKPAVMLLPALGVTCVNVTVRLAENYTVHDPKVRNLIKYILQHFAFFPRKTFIH